MYGVLVFSVLSRNAVDANGYGVLPFPAHVPNAIFRRNLKNESLQLPTLRVLVRYNAIGKVCGNPGTLSFSSPEYQAFEDPSATYAYEQHGDQYVTNGTVRITVSRTGGGHGTVGVRYRLQHGTTDEADVTPHAHYTTRCDNKRQRCI